MFGERLRLLRKQKHLTMEELANKLNLGRSTYAGYETEKRKPTLETLIMLANFHHTTTDYILGLTDNPTSNEEMNDFKKYFEGKQFNWGGIPLTEEELKPIKELLEIVVRDRLPKNNHRF